MASTFSCAPNRIQQNALLLLRSCTFLVLFVRRISSVHFMWSIIAYFWSLNVCAGMLARCTAEPYSIAQTTFRRAIKLQITETSPRACVSRKAVCGPETKLSHAKYNKSNCKRNTAWGPEAAIQHSAAPRAALSFSIPPLVLYYT